MARRTATTPSEARIKANRANAKKSTGPKSVEGKAQSRANALKHGFCATVLPIPGEDAEKFAARGREWVEYYQPQSPAAKHFLIECVRATVLADRLAASHHAHLSYFRYADHAGWFTRLKRDVRKSYSDLGTNPEAVDQLMDTSLGCERLVLIWEALRRPLERTGTWTAARRDRAACLLGVMGSNEAALVDFPEVWLLHVHAACIDRDPYESNYRLDLLFREEFIPDKYFGQITRTNLPTAETAVKALIALADAEIARYRALGATHEQTREVHERGLVTHGSMIQDSMKDSKLSLRYHAEARISFQTNYKGLIAALARDREHPPAPLPEPAPASPPPPAPPAGPVLPSLLPPSPSRPAFASRNEPNAAYSDEMQAAFLEALAAPNPVPSMILFPPPEVGPKRPTPRPPARRRRS